METTTTLLLTIAIVSLCAFPIVIARRNKIKKEKEFKESISKIAGNGASIEKFDRWGTKAVALDNLNYRLYFFSNGVNNGHKVIDLSDVQCASLIKTHHNGGSESSGAIRKVELYLTPKGKGQPNIELDFYDSEHDSLTIRDELQLAEKWSTILESSISKLNQEK
jgi:hypothetical protein